MSPTNQLPELLAPAGDYDSFKAAIQHGANAIYLGVGELNARRRAHNFQAEQLTQLVNEAHEQHVKVYLTLNIDLKDRELRKAATILKAAENAQIDAILIRDPALLKLKESFPKLVFHFSTQAAITSTADAQAAQTLGISRVVLARECNLKEIQEISSVGIETEVFVQGALCYCVSGRCLLSSWGGGRSGNRGGCTSPCRVPWGINESAQAATPLSMADLGLIDHLRELNQANVCSFKIEGRLKTPEWVSTACQLYRRAINELNEETMQPSQHLAAELGKYTGRPLTDHYLEGKTQRLTGTWGRESTESSPEDSTEKSGKDCQTTVTTPNYYDLQIMKSDKGICCSCTVDSIVYEWEATLPEVIRPEKASTIRNYLNFLKENEIDRYLLKRCRSNIDKQLLAPRLINNLTTELGKILRRHKKSQQKAATVSFDLSEETKQLLQKREGHPDNQKPLASKADTVRLHAKEALQFANAIPKITIVVEQSTPELIAKLAQTKHRQRFIIALPNVFFNDRQNYVNTLIQAALKAKMMIEVNSWGGWYLARQQQAKFCAGPGIGIFNRLATETYKELGFSSAYYTIEADRQLLEDTSPHAALPMSLITYGRIPLMISRAEQPKELLDQVWQDRRGIHMIPRRENNLLCYRPLEPMSLLAEYNDKIQVAHLVYDLVTDENPIATWKKLTSTRAAKGAFEFNYNRELI